MTGPPTKLRVGVLVNPIAGLGGKPGLKGSDDAARLGDLLATTGWNEETNAWARGVACIARLDMKRMALATPPGAMGEDVVKRGTKYGGPVFEICRIPGAAAPEFGNTTANDTARYVDRLIEARIDLLLFVGGDGTAADVANAVAGRVPILGVPAGVKMFSPVFAETPETAAVLLNGLAPGFPSKETEVIDLDEASYLQNAWIVRSLAPARVPDAGGIQAGKGGALATEEEGNADLVAWFREHRRPGVTYVMGAGTTVGALKRDLGGGTPLGVDAWRDDTWLAVDAGETTLLEVLGADGPAEIIVSPTGGQGALLGRGTAQITVPVLERVGLEHIIAVATPQKLLGLRRLFVDTGDAELDHSFPDFVNVRTDLLTEKVFAVHKGAPLARR